MNKRELHIYDTQTHRFLGTAKEVPSSVFKTFSTFIESRERDGGNQCWTSDRDCLQALLGHGSFGKRVSRLLKENWPLTQSFSFTHTTFPSGV